LQEGKLASTVQLTELELPLVKSMHLLTMKPMLYVLNKKAGGKNLDEIKDERWDKLVAYLESSKFTYVIVDARIEEELKDMNGEEKAMFRQSLAHMMTVLMT
jgi:ribosome-binding ATPase YchF (GTP1/OBG family)